MSEFNVRYMHSALAARPDAEEIAELAGRLFADNVLRNATYAFAEICESDRICRWEEIDHGFATEEDVKDLLDDYYPDWRTAEEGDLDWEIEDGVEEEEWDRVRSFVWAEQSAEPEIYEWWLVSDWIRRELSEIGHPTSELVGLDWWGRCTTGQSVCLDSAFYEIAANLIDRTK